MLGRGAAGRSIRDTADRSAFPNAKECGAGCLLSSTPLERRPISLRGSTHRLTEDGWLASRAWGPRPSASVLLQRQLEKTGTGDWGLGSGAAADSQQSPVAFGP